VYTLSAGITVDFCFSLEKLQTTSALQLQMHLLSDQPQQNLPQLLHALLMKECALGILVATQVAMDVDPDNHDFTSEILSSLMHVLLLCGENYPDALARVLLPVIER
jgi:hypothetical protein